MEPLEREDTNEEFRVKVTSKKQVIQQINEYKNILQTAFNGQTGVAEETKTRLLHELLANFEAAVQENVLVNGQPWEEAPDVEEEEPLDLESLLDDSIVETTRRRRAYPKQILPHVVHTLRAERKLMRLYGNAVKPQEFVKDHEQEIIMRDLSAAAPVVVTRAIQSISTLQKQAEGLCEIMNTKTSAATLEINRVVLGVNDQSDAASRSRQPIKRAVEESAAAGCYVALSKRHSAEKHTE
ncbi:Kinetochore-associated protein NSL1 like [Dissostichus eleginoides]|uniref:Kinetochore-associated protein NSL1 like n=1 Tax=Dissostichus eleginoides TaxID=100907 RepID=A0AAD9F544_DISEL|nr:Kinetochore-associated protein NSL1 like [Dissostichus eleginoides]